MHKSCSGLFVFDLIIYPGGGGGGEFGIGEIWYGEMWHNCTTFLLWYLRTEAICLGVVVVQPATESTLRHEPQAWMWWLGITSKSPAFETWLHSENVYQPLQR